MYSAQEIQQFLSEQAAQLNACRHHLHQHPEIGLQLPETSAFIEKELRSYGVDEIHKGFGSSALVAVIHGKKKSDKWIEGRYGCLALIGAKWGRVRLS